MPETTAETPLSTAEASVKASEEVSDQAVTKTDDDLLTDEERRIKRLNEKYPRPASFDNDKHGKNPEERANFISTWLFNFMSPMISLGYYRPLGPSDLWKVSKDQDVLKVAPEFDAEWQKCVADAKATNARYEEENNALIAQGLPPKHTTKAEPSLMKATIAYGGANLLWLLFYQLLVRAESILSPLVLEKLLQWLFVGNPVLMPWFVPEEEKWGWIYVVILFIMSSVSNLCNNRFFYVGLHNYTEIRASINALVYTKSLRIASISEEANNDKKTPPAAGGPPDAAAKGPPARGGLGGTTTQSTGQVVNMMAVDSDKVAMVFYIGLNIIYVPVQIAVIIYLIYDILGVSIFVGMAIIILFLPIAAITANAMGNFMRKRMFLSDSRVKLTNEILQGIRIVKFYAWEKHFSHQLEETRMKEVDILRNMQFAIACMTYVLLIYRHMKCPIASRTIP